MAVARRQSSPKKELFASQTGVREGDQVVHHCVTIEHTQK
jgi:hypothetical protein